MKIYVTAEYVVLTPAGALMPAVNADVARPYVLNGSTLLTRKVTMTPTRDSGTARWTYGPWRPVRVPLAVVA